MAELSILEALEVSTSAIKTYVDNKPTGDNSRELTKAQYNALSDTEKNNGKTYYVTDEESFSGEIYSTNEIKIGTWVDDKPLYRKVYTTTLSAATTMSEIIDISSLNASTVIKVGGTFVNSSTGLVVESPYYTSNADTYRVWKYGNAIRVCSSMACTLIVILEYTKTTD